MRNKILNAVENNPWLQIFVVPILFVLFPFVYLYRNKNYYIDVCLHPTKHIKAKVGVRAINNYIDRRRNGLSISESLSKSWVSKDFIYQRLEQLLASSVGSFGGILTFNGSSFSSSGSWDNIPGCLMVMEELNRNNPEKRQELTEICNKLTGHNWGAVRDPAYMTLAKLNLTTKEESQRDY